MPRVFARSRMRVEVLEPHGFCAGVRNALAVACAELEKGLDRSPLYCLHELVHNELIVAALSARGLRFVDTPAEVPEGARLIFSAHGVSPAVREEALARRLAIIDATCPFVRKVHESARAFATRGAHVLVIGHAEHIECRGIVGEALAAGGACTVVDPGLSAAEFSALVMRLKATPAREFGAVAQTTVNSQRAEELVHKLAAALPVVVAAAACHATRERQDAVREFAGDALLVLGSTNSSNTRRLAEVAPCARVFRAGTLAEVKALELRGVEVLGLTAGASTPDDFFEAAKKYLDAYGG